MNTSNSNDNNNPTIEPEPEENKPRWALPPESVLATASLDQRAILYAETLERIAAAGETVDPGWVRAKTRVDRDDPSVKNAPPLLAEVPEFAAKAKEGKAKLPTTGAAWHWFWKREAKKAAKASATSPIGDSETSNFANFENSSPIGEVLANSDSNSNNSSPIGEVLAANSGVEVAVLEEVSEPEPEEQERRQRFEELKRIVRAGLNTFLEVGAALAEIRAEKFYRLAGFAVFDDFLRAEYNLSRAYGYRLMDAVASVEDLSSIPGIPAPTNPEQVRPLAGLSREEKRELWTEAVRTAPNSGPPTGAFVRKIREARGKTKAAAKAKPAATTNTKKPNVGGESATTVPSRNEGAISLEAHLDLAADALERSVGEWKRESLAPLKEAARSNKQIREALVRLERDLDLLLKRLPDCAWTLRFRSAEGV
jgi:hypothetical protein